MLIVPIDNFKEKKHLIGSRHIEGIMALQLIENFRSHILCLILLVFSASYIVPSP